MYFIQVQWARYFLKVLPLLNFSFKPTHLLSHLLRHLCGSGPVSLTYFGHRSSSCSLSSLLPLLQCPPSSPSVSVPHAPQLLRPSSELTCSKHDHFLHSKYFFAFHILWKTSLQICWPFSPLLSSPSWNSSHPHSWVHQTSNSVPSVYPCFYPSSGLTISEKNY